MRKEYDFSKLRELKNLYAREAVGINLSPEVVDYFKRLAEETGLPYQKLIDLYLLDCARKAQEADNEVGSIAATNYSSCGKCFGVILQRIACADIGLIN